MWRHPLMLLAFGLGACGGATSTAEAPASPAEAEQQGPGAPGTAPVAEPLGLRRLAAPVETGPRRMPVTVTWPEGTARPDDRLFLTWLTPEDLGPQGPSMQGVIVAMARASVFERGDAAGSTTLPLSVAAGPVGVLAVFDREKKFWPTVFGANVPGNAKVVVEPRSRSDGPVTIALVPMEPAPPPQETCAGDRFEVLDVTTPGVTGSVPGKPSRHRLCAYLPASYAKDTKQRYPVVYVFPGFAGNHAAAFRGKEHLGTIADDVASDLKREVLLVGVDTSTPYGSSYLTDSPRHGDWGVFTSSTLVAAVDGHFRTITKAKARAASGHSTGGFDAVSIAMRFPHVFGVALSSSPDALTLRPWLLDAAGAKAKPHWLGWMRVEDALGGAGQFTSYGAAWSPNAKAARGFDWPVDLATGAPVEAVLSQWEAASPYGMLQTQEGLARAKKLSGHLFLTTGQKDEAELFDPSERFAKALAEAGIERVWAPTPLGHLGALRDRWEPMLRYFLKQAPKR